MNSQRITADEDHDQFWSVVRDCLREFHGMQPPTTRRKALELRNRIEALSKGAIELFYHSEPFDVACKIAERPLQLEKHLKRYLELRDEKHGFSIQKQNVRRPSK